MSEYKNEDGEWMMDGAAIRLEQSIDAQAAEERFEDDFYSRDWEDDEETECDVCTGDHPTEEHDDFAAEGWEMDESEDAWLDGSYEE